MAAAADERAWQRALDDHAAAVMLVVCVNGANGFSRSAPPMGDRPTIEIRGPDGEWRRYYVRLTEVRSHG